MQRQISEADWKLMQRLQPIALERFCQAILSEVVKLASDTAQGSHARYLKVFKLIQQRDEEIGEAFNEMKRSTSLFKLARMRSLGLMTEEEFAGFSSETKDLVSLFLDS